MAPAPKPRPACDRRDRAASALPNNDLPGILSANAALVYLRRYGVAAGRKVVVATNNGLAAAVAKALGEAGSDVALVDFREGRQIVEAVGRGCVRAV